MDLRIFYAAAVLPHASVPATVSQRLLGGMINASLVCAVCALVPLPPAGRVGAGAGVILVCVVSQALTGAGPGGAGTTAYIDSYVVSAGFACRFRRFRVSFPPVSAKRGGEARTWCWA